MYVAKENGDRMSLIKSIDELYEIINKNKEIIVYGIGDVGSTVLDYLRLHNWFVYNKISCVAVKNFSDNPKRYKEKEIYQYTDLICFRENGVVIILTDENKHESITADLSTFGFKRIVGLNNYVFWQIKAIMQSFHDNLLSQINYQLYVLNEKIDDIKYQVCDQNEISAVNTMAFSEYRNLYRGKELVILATGPSMKKYKPIKNAIHIGVNTAHRRDDIELDFLFTQDFNREYDWMPIYGEEMKKAFERIKNRIFIGSYSPRLPYHEIEYPEEYSSINKKIRRYFVGKDSDYIYKNICYHPLMDNFSVVFPAVHFALFTYPRKIYIVGCDVSDKGQHFDSDEELYDNPTWLHKMGWLRVKKFAELHYPETEFISINPVGLTGLFKDVYKEK